MGVTLPPSVRDVSLPPRRRGPRRRRAPAFLALLLAALLPFGASPGGTIAALEGSVAAGAAAPADVTARDAAIRRILAARRAGRSRLADAVTGAHASLETIERLATEALAAIRSGMSPAGSLALQRAVLERANLEAALEAARLEAGAAADALAGLGRGAAASRLRSGRTRLAAAGGRVLEPLRLLSQVTAGRGGAGRAEALLDRLLRAVRSSLDEVRRESDPATGVTRREPPDVRLDPVELGAGPAPAAPVVDAARAAGGSGPTVAPFTLTPDIIALAGALDFDPLKIYRHVRDNFRFEPYFGYLKGPQATLETGGGNDYDLGALTGALLEASGYTTRFVRGTVIVPAEAMSRWLGLDDPSAANTILNTAGISAIPVTINSVLDHYRVDRVWIEVQAPLPRGAGLAWFPLDTAWKQHDLTAGLPGLLAAVPFDEAGYLSIPRPELTWEYYREQVRDHVEATFPGKTLADVPLGMSLVPETLGSLPRSLPTTIYALSSVFSPIPASLAHAATVRLRYAGSTQFSHPLVLPESLLSRLTLSYAVNPADQAIVDAFGGLANTPPFAVDVIPRLKVDGVLVAQGGLIPYLDLASLEIDFTRPGVGYDGTSYHTTRAGEWAAIGIDGYQISETFLSRTADTIVAATALEAAGGTADPDDLLGALLQYAIQEYHRDVRRGDGEAAALTHFRNVRFVSEGVAEANQQVITVGGTPFTTVPGGLVVDVPRLFASSFALDGNNALRPALRRITGFNGSAQEHGIWEELLNVPSVSTIKSLQLANDASIPILVIDNTDADPNNNCSVLCPQLNLSASTEADIQSRVVSQGQRVTVPRDPTPLQDWNGVGYIAETVSTGSAAYMISGGLASAGPGGPPGGGAPGEASGGAIAVVLQDGTILIIPVGALGDAAGTSLTGDPVNISSGNFFHDETDFAIPALSEPLGFRRAYNSSSTDDGPLGLGWSHPWSDRLVPQAGGEVIWIDGRGTAYTFAPGGTPGTWTAPPGLRETLSGAGAGWTLRRYDGLVRQFDAAGRMLSRTDRYGSAFTFGYDGSGRLVAVTDPAARALTLTYNGAGKIATVADFTARTWTYAYDASNRLAQVTSPSDAQTPARISQYQYDAAGRMTRLVEPGGAAREIRYYASGRVAQVIDPLGRSMTLLYNPYKSETRVVDERGLLEVHAFNAAGNLTALTHADGTVERWTWADNRITSHTDEAGGVEVFEYDTEGNLVRGVDPTMRETIYEYEPVYGNLTRIVRPGNREFLYAYDASGALQTFTDPESGQRTYVNGPRGLPLTVTDPRLVVTAFTYGPDGQPLTRSIGASFTESFTYNPRGTLATHTDADNRTRTLAYDLLDRRIGQTDAALGAESHGYDAAGNLSRVADARGSVTTFEYDPLHRLVRKVHPDGADERFAYDGAGNLVAQTDELGRTTRHEYDARNRRIATRFPDGAVSRQRFDAVGRPVASVDPLGNETTYAYDAAGRLVRSVDALGNDSTRQYDAAGNLEIAIDRLGGVTRFTYDRLNRITKVEGEAGRLETIDYDGNGNELERARYDVSGLVTVPPDPRTLPEARKRRLVRTWDDLNRNLTAADPEGGLTVKVLSPAGDVLSVTDPRTKTTTYEYTPTHTVKKVVRPDLGATQIVYDRVGNRTKVTAATGGSWAWTYDARNRVTSQTDPLGNVTSWEYDRAGNLRRQLNPDGTWVARTYDAMNRLRRLARSDGTWTDRAYDAAGNLVRVTTEKTVLTFAHDALNRRTGETIRIPGTSFNKTVQYAYDDESSLRSVTDPTGRILTYGRDLAGQLTGVTSSTLGAAVAITRNGWGERAHFAYANGRAGDVAYDRNGRPTLIDWTTAVARFQIARDAAGNPTSVVEGVGGAAETLTIAYDDLGRPTGVTAAIAPGVRSETFAYDLNGNLTNPGNGTTLTYNPANQPATDGARTFTHDRRGNRASMAPTAGSIVETPHDPENRITAIKVGASQRRFTYDGLGRLVEIDHGGGLYTRIVNAGENRLVEYDAAGAVTARWTASERADDVFALETGGTSYWFHGDAIGSVRAITNAAGAVAGTRHYGQFGRVLAASGLPTLPIGFTSRPTDAASGLVDLRARSYDPSVGAFISTDPLGVLSSFPNPYAYANTRPGMFVDPLGLSPEGPSWSNRLFGLLGALGGAAEVTLGALGLMAPTGITQILGGALAIHGVDTLQANLRQLWTGEDVRTLTSQGLSGAAEALGAGDQTAYYIGEFGDAGIGIVLSLGTSAALKSGQIANAVVNTGDNVVYQSFNSAGDVEYIGITNNLERRAAEHLGDTGRVIESIPGLSNLSRADARAVEQVLIESYGLARNGGTLSNSINSIAATNPIYATSIQRGQQILVIIGYKP